MLRIDTVNNYYGCGRFGFSDSDIARHLIGIADGGGFSKSTVAYAPSYYYPFNGYGKWEISISVRA